MKYYRVLAKSGHVGGPSKYILINHYIEAESRKAAAESIRWAPRVKHDHKDAIRDVCEVSYAEYCEGKKAFNDDPYNRCSNPQEQALVWDCILPRVQDEKIVDYRAESRKRDTRPNAKRARNYGYDSYDMRIRKRGWDYEDCA